MDLNSWDSWNGSLLQLMRLCRRCIAFWLFLGRVGIGPGGTLCSKRGHMPWFFGSGHHMLVEMYHTSRVGQFWLCRKGRREVNWSKLDMVCRSRCDKNRNTSADRTSTSWCIGASTCAGQIHHQVAQRWDSMPSCICAFYMIFMCCKFYCSWNFPTPQKFLEFVI